MRNDRITEYYQNAWEFGYRDFQDIPLHRLSKEKDWICKHCGAKFWVTKLFRKTTSMEQCCGLAKRVLAETNLFRKPRDPQILSQYYSSLQLFIGTGRSLVWVWDSRPADKAAVVDRQVRFMASTHVAGLHNLNEAYLYFMDVSEEVVNARTNLSTVSTKLEISIVRMLENYLRAENVLMRIFKNAGDIYEEEKLKAAAESREVLEVILCVNLRDKEDEDGSRFEFQRRKGAAAKCGMQYPRNETVAGVYLGDRPLCYYDVKFAVKPLQEDTALPYREVNVLRCTLDLMLHPLIHLHGEYSFQQNNRDPVNSLREYYCHVGKLRLQYLVDAGVKIEYNNVSWAIGNQRHMRAETYANLRDFLLKEVARRGLGDSVQLQPVGKIIVLPPTIPGSRRYYFNGYMDCMGVCRKLGRSPTYFLTFTANRQWSEVTEELRRLGKGTDDIANFPDILCRIFEQKLDSLMRDLLQRQILGKIEAYVVRIEFQMRRAPHAHILLFVMEQDVPDSAEDLDRVIWARWPVQSDGAGY
ncbi:unnamed protein product [Ceutorhynchus assimilis]|uniref:Helitron helicase-like domain-containing protein n=1 Tax=Ceutorhynchus assimilis TaxID=467358 RepID=A0A9N9MLY0_9CUCU|nr:unnamed protein product [Ceutorhynchus assimilis]